MKIFERWGNVRGGGEGGETGWYVKLIKKNKKENFSRITK